MLYSPDGQRKIHKEANLLVGGIAILVPVVRGAVASALTTGFVHLYWVLAAAIAASLMLWLLDDRTHLRAALRPSALLVIALVHVIPKYAVTFVKFSSLAAPIFQSRWSPSAIRRCAWSVCKPSQHG